MVSAEENLEQKDAGVLCNGNGEQGTASSAPIPRPKHIAGRAVTTIDRIVRSSTYRDDDLIVVCDAGFRCGGLPA